MPKKVKLEKVIADRLVYLRMEKLEKHKLPPANDPRDEHEKFKAEIAKQGNLIGWLMAHDLHITINSYNIRMTKEQGGAFIGYSCKVDEIGQPEIIGIQLSPLKAMIDLHDCLKEKMVVTAYFNGKSARVKY